MASETDSPGLRTAASRFANSAIALFRARFELATVEFAEERERIQLRLALVFAGVLMIMFALLGVGALVVVWLWETNRTAAMLGVSAVFAAIGIALILRARAIGREAPTPFAATIAELEKDRAWLGGHGPE